MDPRPYAQQESASTRCYTDPCTRTHTRHYTSIGYVHTSPVSNSPIPHLPWQMMPKSVICHKQLTALSETDGRGLCHETTAHAARLERSGIVMRKGFFVFGLADVQGSRRGGSEVVATLPQMRELRDFVCGEAWCKRMD